jgi:hypothetical protein
MGGGMEIRKGVVRDYDAGNHEADVQIIGSMATVVRSVPVADDVGALSAGDICAVLFFRGDPGVVFCRWEE